MTQTSTAAVAAKLPQVGDTDGKYLTFWTDGQLFGIPISHVEQIVGMQEITPIPEFPSHAKGIINLRGSIIPLVDVRLRLGRAEAAYNERTCIIVTTIGELVVGFIVDEVDEVTHMPDDVISPPPTLSGGASCSFLTGVARHENRVVLLLDTARILSDEELSQFSGL